MTLPRILAENWGPLIELLILVPLALAVISIGGVALNRRRGRRRWWGLIVALIPTIGGGLLLLMFLTVRGGAPVFFHLIAAVPFLYGLRSLYLWSRTSEP